MQRWIMPVVVAWVLAAGAGVARAAEQDLGYQLVVHTSEVHSLPVPDQEGHAVGVAAFRGLAIFDDGQIASHWYSGGFDFIDGSGPFHGYALWAFEDGSRIRSTYVGEAKATEGGGITFEGRHTDLSGTGRYAGIEGEGSFSGRRIDHLEGGGDTYQRGRLTLTMPAE